MNGWTTLEFKRNVLKSKAFQINRVHKEIDNAHKAVRVNQLIQTVDLHLIAWFAFNVVHSAVALFNCIKISNLSGIHKPFAKLFQRIFQAKYAGLIRILCMFLVCIIPEVYKFRKQGKRRFLRSLTTEAKRIWRFAGVFTVA